MGKVEGASVTLQVTLYTKPGCHLCENLLASLRAMQIEMDFQIVERNIELDSNDFERFRHLVPVLEVPGCGLLFPPHDSNAIRQAIGTVIRTRSDSP
jgi:hypothetical protein